MTARNLELRNGSFVRKPALQPQNFAAPLINDRFSRGIAAVAGCVPRPKDGLCKHRYLRIAAISASRSERRLSALRSFGLQKFRRKFSLASDLRGQNVALL
jgi:hypothetical protein